MASTLRNRMLIAGFLTTSNDDIRRKERRVVFETSNDNYTYISQLIYLYRFGKKDIKILFLDVDGVLNTTEDCYMGSYPLNETLLKRCKTIIQKTNCKIVLSSAWRQTEKDKFELFKAFKMKANVDILDDNIYIGDTPVVDLGMYRTREIRAYLQNSHVNTIYNITAWCAIDDKNLINPSGASTEIKQECFELMNNHFVHINERYGLTDDDVNHVISILT